MESVNHTHWSVVMEILESHRNSLEFFPVVESHGIWPFLPVQSGNIMEICQTHTVS